jgi:hypothetical protein
VAASSGADRCGDELREAGVAVSLGADVNAVAAGADVVGPQPRHAHAGIAGDSLIR